MRVIIQRVTAASVVVDGNIVGQIGNGLLCLVGVERNDTLDDTKWCTNKICNIRLWNDEAKGKPWQNSVKSSGYELLLVSQFTLHAVLKGNKPDFSHSKRPEEAKKMFDEFVTLSKSLIPPEKVKTGIFGAKMDVSLVNDGPVTITIDSEKVNFKRKIKRPCDEERSNNNKVEKKNDKKKKKKKNEETNNNNNNNNKDNNDNNDTIDTATKLMEETNINNSNNKKDGDGTLTFPST